MIACFTMSGNIHVERDTLSVFDIACFFFHNLFNLSKTKAIKQIRSGVMVNVW